MTDSSLIHASAEVHSQHIGVNTHVSQFCVVCEDAKIGVDTKVGSHCYIDNNVVIGDRVTIKSGVHLWEGISIGDDVTVGPNVSFANAPFSNATSESSNTASESVHTVLEDGVSIGGGATLVAGITVGKGALVAAGSVVTKSVPAYTMVKGSPARVSGYVNRLSKTEGDQVVNVSKLNSVPLRGDQTEVALGAGASIVKRLKFVEDMRGNLSVGEFPSDIPFKPERYFLVFDVPNQEVRGSHAHKECEQFLICVKGSLNVMVDDGSVRSEVVLDSPDLGVYIPPLVWGTQYRYSEDAVLLVFASHSYDDADYIRDYKDFQSIAKS